MPPAMLLLLALGWVERSWQRSPESKNSPQVDTRMVPAAADRGVADAVVIEADPELPAAAADELGAEPHALARVRDDAMFRSAEDDAWFQIWMTLRSSDMRSLSQAPARAVSFGELFGQPLSFRGRLVRFRGTLRRLEKLSAPANPYNITDYWQGWLEPEGGPASPIVVYFLRLPTGMPEGLKIDEPVEVIGYFFKRWAYAATDTVRIAPLVMGLEPVWKPRPAGPPPGNPIGTVALVTMVGIVLLTMLGIRAAGRGGPQRLEPQPRDLSTALSGVEVYSTEEALRRMADADRIPETRMHETQTPNQESSS
jgi:hypothetical protein